MSTAEQAAKKTKDIQRIRVLDPCREQKWCFTWCRAQLLTWIICCRVCLCWDSSCCSYSHMPVTNIHRSNTKSPSPCQIATQFKTVLSNAMNQMYGRVFFQS